MFDATTTIQTFLDAAAAKQPAPGGGSVSALVGALGAAMGEMTVTYSVGKKGLEAHQAELANAVREFHRARQLLVELMLEDQRAYEALTAARKLPEGSRERADREPAALLASIRTPQAIGATAAAVLQLCDGIVDKVNFYLLSDLAVCADLAMATARCASYNVRVNLSSVADEAERQAQESATTQSLRHAGMLVRRVSTRVWERHGGGR